MPATLADGQRALGDVQAALAQDKAVIVGVDSAVLWNAAHGEEASGTTNYIDTAYGKGMAVPIGAFMNAWQSDDYETIVVEQAVSPTSVGTAA